MGMFNLRMLHRRNPCWKVPGEMCAAFFKYFIFMGENLEKSQEKTARISERLKKISYLELFKGIFHPHQKEENERESYKHGSTSTRRRENHFNLRKKSRIRSSSWKLKSGKLKVEKGLLFFSKQTIIITGMDC